MFHTLKQGPTAGGIGRVIERSRPFEGVRLRPDIRQSPHAAPISLHHRPRNTFVQRQYEHKIVPELCRYLIDHTTDDELRFVHEYG